MNLSQDRTQRLEHLLRETLEPTYLEVIDESHKHRGHTAAKQGLGHYAVIIASPYFDNQRLIKCHKMVYQACQSMMDQEIHALSIHIRRNSHGTEQQANYQTN